MEELISETEIKKLGFKPESRLTWVKKAKVGKGVERYVKCNHCGCLFYSKQQVDATGKLQLNCFWCSSNNVIRLVKK